MSRVKVALLSRPDDNTLTTVRRVCQALKDAGQLAEAREFKVKATACMGMKEFCQLVLDTVDVI